MSVEERLAAALQGQDPLVIFRRGREFEVADAAIRKLGAGKSAEIVIHPVLREALLAVVESVGGLHATTRTNKTTGWTMLLVRRPGVRPPRRADPDL